MKAIIGLGNPGLKYDGTRHNVGFEVLDHLNKKLHESAFKKIDKLFSETVLVSNSGSSLLLAKPTTYMNDSGKAFLALKNWYKIDIDEFLVVHDDVSLPLGKIRLQKGGGAGGQHGIESIIEMLGGQKSFNRLKVGIGPDPGGDKRANYVLQKFPQYQKSILEKIIFIASDAALLWLTEGIDKAMNEFNGTDLSIIESPPESI